MERIWNLFMYAFKKPNKFEGRACRMEAISFAIVQFIIFALFGVLMALLIPSAVNKGGFASILMIILGLVFFIFCILLIIPGLGVACRRLHDLNLSGWLLLLYFVPFINSIVGIVFFVMLYFIPGTIGSNQYGPVSENY